MDAKLIFLWMTWIFQLHNCNQLETKVIPHFQRRRKNISDASNHISSTSFNDAATLLAENIRTVGVEISKSIASEVLIQKKSEMTIQESALKLYPTLCEVEGLIKDERYHALSKIPDHPTQMLIFFSLPSFVRLELVKRFLVDH
ncbi:putative protease yhbU [Gossypium arboreum]|uniref:Putative protease yhbU n=1 Tax=Gossypium arboreum TaxID=29729 RepID=A0A0B0NUM9_GOSAR|nr:putative protease yhbU [Gossypium arboreum]